MSTDSLEIELKKKMQELSGISRNVSTYQKLKKEINIILVKLGRKPMSENNHPPRPSKKNNKINKDIRKNSYRLQHPLFH